jgi:hypothetical protein
MGPDERQPCPVCGESIAMTARQCRFCGEVLESRDAADPQSEQSANDGYSVFTDTVTGVNLRWKDNLFQGVFVVISVLVCGLLGVVLAASNPRCRRCPRRSGVRDLRQWISLDDLSRPATSQPEATLTSSVSLAVVHCAAMRCGV